MRQVLISCFIGFFCLGVGVLTGLLIAPQINVAQLPKWMRSVVASVSGGGAITPTDENLPYEMYDYPTIKWRPKPVAGVNGAIVQLWTTFEGKQSGGGQLFAQGKEPNASEPGKIKYRFTAFKAPNKLSYEVQLLDKNGFKLMQFDVSDFHQIPGAADIMEARESFSCTEDEYRRVQDYSIK